MRLVCDQCNAVYTIDDGIVGTRDFRVSCKACGRPIYVKSARQVGATQRLVSRAPSLPPPALSASTLGRSVSSRPPPSGLPRPALPPPALPPPSVRPPPLSTPVAPAVPSRPPAAVAEPAAEQWFVMVNGVQRGPHTAAQMARMLEQGSIEWGSEVWREGLKGWRPARRDASLVTAVAGARGVANDTTRLNAARSFLAPEDTVVEARPPLPAASSPSQPPARTDSGPTETELPKLHRNPLTQDPNLDLRPSVRPQAWHTEQNAAFRAALGLPRDSQPLSPASPPAGNTLGDALRSAPTLLDRSSAERHIRKRSRWFDGMRGLVTIGVACFAAGALSTLGLQYLSAPSEGHSVRAVPSAPAPKPEPMLPVQTLPVSAPSSVALPPQAPLRELPTVEDMRGEVRKVTADVKRCVEDPSAGVDVDIYFDGPSGRVRDVDVRSPLITPGRVVCIVQAVRRMQLSPFARSELKLMHKFSW